MVILLNGPLGIGKSTLAEALSESIGACVMLDGDHLIAVNPPPSDTVSYLHTILAMLFRHHRRFGYRHFVIDYLWRSPEELADLGRRFHEIDAEADIRCMLLVLPLAENLRRIRRRQGARAIDEREFEQQTVLEERATLYESGTDMLGEPFDVSEPPEELVKRLLFHVGLGNGAD